MFSLDCSLAKWKTREILATNWKMETKTEFEIDRKARFCKLMALSWCINLS